MGLKFPRGKYERRNVLLAAKVWGTADPHEEPCVGTCRNISARGCRFMFEDEKRCPLFDIDSPIRFWIDLSPWRPHPAAYVKTGEVPETVSVEGSGRVVWTKREHGEPGRIQLLIGVEFAVVSFADRERIKEFIVSLPAE